MKKIAFVFPGQGSQSVGMLADLATDSVVAQTIQQASAALDQDLLSLMQVGPAEALNLTTHTQPVMLTAGLAFYRAWCARNGAAPAIMAGHSLGEYTALAAANALSLEDAVRLVRFRAQAMQEAVPVGMGGMAAILGLDDEAVTRVCQAASLAAESVEAVNFNAPAQVVIAGHKAAVDRACELAKAQGAKRALPLPVSAPFHSSLMQPAAKRLEAYLAEVSLHSPTIAVVNNIDVAIQTDPALIRQALVRQAAGPVRWVETIRYFAAQGVTHVIECGPGKVLTGLTKRIEPTLTALAITDQSSLEQALLAVNAE
ncbi:ACP S-malonyltransferase [Parvibium lacunae]|uniref:Malonyl CoA-acyl carrier protein transacylase n=1 Tax=Parvibium lacunae TaxID=1888893 RepID=A0A368L3S2_9BURK|nr:ACP S-malonyltransferase [Parvibium lacunae]RCS58238.1 [acyl-carrier-protein] S-malonyltransferase [Parvibium lacunae]